MAKNRMVNCKFWSDNWVRGYLDPLTRYLFLYFITNEHSNLCGIYELPISTMSFETGLKEEELIKKLLPKLEPKILYQDGWVYITNFEKYHVEGSPMIKLGVEKSKNAVPSKIIELFNKKLEGINTLSPLTLTLTLTSTLTSKESEGINTLSPQLSELTKPHIEKYGQEMIDKFLNYWTQKNHNGKKELWQMQKVFDVPKRLATWASKDWNKPKKLYDSITI